MKKIIEWLPLLCITLFLFGCSDQKNKITPYDELKVSFNGDAIIEVGGPYIGAEFHHSSPLAQRISFFYPVANSIDLSTDYWKRDTSFVMNLGLKIGNTYELLGGKNYSLNLTPFDAVFMDSTEKRSIEISYLFAKDESAMIIIYEITNLLSSGENFELSTYMDASLRTCHTYNLKEKAWTEFYKSGNALIANYDDPETQQIQLFSANAGEVPAAYSSISNPKLIYMDPDSFKENMNFDNLLISKDNPSRPAFAFFYKRELDPGEKFRVVQIIGSTAAGEANTKIDYLVNHYSEEIDKYNNSVLKYASLDHEFLTGDKGIDHSAKWAKSILAANSHYLDGELVPMPCPAEYNFYFTHDALQTDFSAVNYDLDRVKEDLDYIVRRSENNIIPHAYYWKDSSYVTEFANDDNWNNYWFIFVSGSYLRHSADKAFVEKLYPYITKCLHQGLLLKKEDGLVWSYQPDWWDIGHIFGARAYRTIMAIKSIKEYIYISASLGMNLDSLKYYENLSLEMQNALVEKLWDDDQKYLISDYEPGIKDTHYYIGSLFAAHLGLLDSGKTHQLITTAENKLLDKKVGVYDLFPMDFHILKDYMNFVGNEAGDPFYYGNGGIWPHGNAWYALGLMEDNRKPEALEFLKNIMTLEGIMKGPNGQPAMYEVRIGDYNDPSVYGRVDKPQFLWAGGWYLYTLYHLYGIDENEWNIKFDPFLAPGQKSCEFSLSANGYVFPVALKGEGNYVNEIRINQKRQYSLVIPSGSDSINSVEINLGELVYPLLLDSKSKVTSVLYNEDLKNLTIRLAAFKGHESGIKVLSPRKPKQVWINNVLADTVLEYDQDETSYKLNFGFIHLGTDEELRIDF